jgi:hypothetical protein
VRVHSHKPNFSLRETVALREMQNKYIYISPVDKRNNVVILDFLDYSDKINTLLADPSYEPISSNSIKKGRKINEETNTAVHHVSGNHKLVIPKDIRMPPFYSLPKIHRSHAPLGPIFIALPTIPHPASCAENSQHFV